MKKISNVTIRQLIAEKFHHITGHWHFIISP